MAIHVTIYGDDPELRDRCHTAFAGTDMQLVAGDTLHEVALIVAESTEAVVPAIVAMILVGDMATVDHDLPYDAQLPADFTDRELRLACQLAARLSAARRSLSEARLTERSLQKQVETDPLTGLANRRSWDAALTRFVEQSMAEGTPLTLAIFDLDHFKQINSQHGYATGDRVLKAVGAALSVAIRGHDFAARFGGDEFGLLLPGLPSDRAASVVERIRLAVNRANDDPPVTASAGLANLYEGESTADELFAAADRRLREAKASGGNRTVSG